MKPKPYRCNKCGAILMRDSSKAWFKSICSLTGKDARLYRVTKRNNPLTPT